MSEKKDVYTKTIEGIDFYFDTKEEGDAVATAYYLLEDPNKNVYEVINTYHKTNKVGNKQILHGGGYDDTTNPGTNGDNASNTNTNGDTYASLKANLDQYLGSAYSNADQYLGSAYSNAESLRGTSYAQALKTRQEAEALAEIQRKRGVVDASTMAEQQKATYGANAEQVGRMGLQVSGYSDYLNSQAYAAGMAARQSANAQATDIKRQALYQEAIARLDADKAYSQATADADKVYFQATSEADKTYYGGLNDIEAAKIADTQEQEQQKQTNYQKFMEFALSNYKLDSETLKSIGSSVYGVTDTNKLEKVIGAATSYAEAVDTGDTLTDGQISDLERKRDAYIIEKNYVGAAKINAKLEYPNATPEQLQLYESNEIVSIIETIARDPSSWLAIANNLVNYGETGAKNIKEAFSNAVPADSLGKYDLKAVIDSGLLTDEAKSRLEVKYANEYEGKELVSVYDESYGSHSFGNFDDGEEQTELIESIKAMVEGKIKGYRQGDGKQVELKAGDIVYVNYGFDAVRGDCYEYLDNGVFKKIAVADTADKQIILPEGFYFEAGEVRKGKVVEVSNDSSFTVFGNFWGSKDKDSEQAKYTKKIIDMVLSGDIKEGEYVCVNYGAINSTPSYYRYLGNNKLMAVAFLPDSADIKYPEGYKESFWKDAFTWGAVKE